MTAGYVRLSRDDDKRNYSSIENQKLIIRQYATEHNLVIDRWYEDDGISGYLFDRPGFNRLIQDLDCDIETVLVKDFSRLGRHNARILLLLDYFKEQGRHLIVIDDHYDSETSEDDMIGITTWFNERYVKDTSRKIRQAIGARQKEGTLIVKPPFGYQRSNTEKKELEIVSEEAKIIRLVFDLYMQGLGYRKISEYLTEKNFPTPSMIRRRHDLESGQNSHFPLALKWSDGMVRDILGNDFYTGTLRLRKRTRKCIHGKDSRVPKEEQYVFPDHHPPIIDGMTFALVQELKEKRARSGYRGSRQKQSGAEALSLFGSCLYCKDCGRKLTQIRRKTSSGEHKYYICSTYNSKGKHYCSKSHLIREQELIEAMVYYLQVCRNTLYHKLSSYDRKEFKAEVKTTAKKAIAIQDEIDESKQMLQTLLIQKINDISANPDKERLIKESYDSIQLNLTAHISTLEDKLNELKITESGTVSKTIEDKRLPTAPEIMDHVIQNKNLNRKDIEILVDCIYVDENGFPEITLKYEFT